MSEKHRLKQRRSLSTLLLRTITRALVRGQGGSCETSLLFLEITAGSHGIPSRTAVIL